jgi:predicted deacetylase
LTPRNREAGGRFLRDVSRLGIDRVSLSVVPRWHGEASFHRDRTLVEWLRDCLEAGHELCLHGCFHVSRDVRGGPVSQLVGRVYTACEGEFYQLTRQEAARRIEVGRESFRHSGLHPAGFVPPAWLLSEDALQAVREAGLGFATSLNHVRFISGNRVLHAPALVVSSRCAWRRLVSRAWVPLWIRCRRRLRVLRVAVHPVDWEHAAVRELLTGAIRRLTSGRDVTVYGELRNEP